MSAIVLCLILDSRQNFQVTDRGLDDIVLCLILDSRQNFVGDEILRIFIVLCLILDSRQNVRVVGDRFHQLYCALFWIQGKTCWSACVRRNILYCALFWIQGKTHSSNDFKIG